MAKSTARVKFYSIEGNTLRFDGGSLYGHIPKALWEKWTPADALNRVQLASRTLLAQTKDGLNILFDVGVGDFFEPKLKERYGIQEKGLLLQNLKKVGVEESDIDIIILSHLHFDHAGGLLSEDASRLLFPNAKYYLSRAHYSRALKPHIREKASFIPALFSLLESSKRLIFIEGERHPDLDFGVTFKYSEGHTVGLMLSLLDTDVGPLAYASDLIPGIPWLHLPVTSGYDRFPELLVDEKEKLLKYLVERQGNIFLTHDLHTPCVKVTLDSSNKYVGVSMTL